MDLAKGSGRPWREASSRESLESGELPRRNCNDDTMDVSARVQLFLKSEVPDWDDNVISASRFKALTGQRSDWEIRFLFWRDLIIKVARHLQLLVIDTHAVQHCWFVRGGLTPLCLNQVLTEMYKCGDLQQIDSLKMTTSKFSWFWQKIRNGIFSESQNDHMDSTNISDQLLAVTTLVHERVTEVRKLVSESSWNDSCIVTMVQFIKLSGCNEAANLLLKELTSTKKGQVFCAEGNRQIQGIKLSLTDHTVSEVTKMDCYMLHIYWALEKVYTQIMDLEQSYNRSKQSAIRALQFKDRNLAKRHANSMRILVSNKSKCEDFQGRIQEMLDLISQAETTKHVSEAMKVGNLALKQHIVPLEDIEECLHEMDTVIAQHKQVSSTLAYEPSDDDLDLELAEMELELEKEMNKRTKGPSLPVIQSVFQNCESGEKSEAAAELSVPADLDDVKQLTVDEIEHDLKGLRLELESA